jgi:RNA polymerase sigma factor for flagellar operon FliA
MMKTKIEPKSILVYHRGAVADVEHPLQSDEFIRQYEPFVRGIVSHTRAQLGLECDVEDLVAFGYEGLLEAHKRFDASRGVQFKSFAYYRVRGAVLDGVRRMAYLPRRAYARLKASEAADLEGDAASQAHVGAAAADVESTLRAIDGVLGAVAAAYCVAADAPNADPEESVLARERRELVHAALDTLPEQERLLIRGHYIEGRNFDEIAAELGLSKSWASRLHTRALARMREALGR